MDKNKRNILLIVVAAIVILGISYGWLKAKGKLPAWLGGSPDEESMTTEDAEVIQTEEAQDGLMTPSNSLVVPSKSAMVQNGAEYNASAVYSTGMKKGRARRMARRGKYGGKRRRR